MTTIGDLLGPIGDLLIRDNLSVGDVHILPLGRNEGITPKVGDTKDKYFVILGFDTSGNVIGGVVVNSKVNNNLPTSVTDYLMPISASKYPFLKHNSFVNCSRLKTTIKDKFNSTTYRGRIEDEETIRMIVGTLFESPYTNKQQLKEYGIIKEKSSN